ncbi:MAG: AAA family ATPase [Deltaproteobacteria bacterium]|nr:AAA family ATPase [Deltaproteobacteria bacterium]MBW1921218.1 AAA family ATPase [Deltaproteobacteria bacterium]
MELTVKDKEALRKIAEFEEHCKPDSLEGKLGWSWDSVSVWPATLNRLLTFGLLEIIYHSNSYRGMRLTKEGREQAELLRVSSKSMPLEASQNQKLEVPEDIFDEIIGHQEVKELLRACLTAEKPVHVLLAGPPALAKTLFLWDIERAAGEKAVWLVGSATSKAGLWDVVAERQPSVVLIDELDKMNAADTAALLSMMEGGRLVRAKKGRELDLRQEIRVVAATNRLEVLSPELKSRFAIRRVGAYGRDEYLTVVKGVLVHRENVPEEMAEEIATRLDGRSQDVRDAVRVARLAPGLGVKRAIELLLPGG